MGSFMHSSNDLLSFMTQSVFSIQARRERAASLHFFAYKIFVCYVCIASFFSHAAGILFCFAPRIWKTRGYGVQAGMLEAGRICDLVFTCRLQSTGN